MLVPLQLPGGLELLVLLFVLAFNLLIVVAVIAGVVYLLRRLGGEDEAEKIEELERRIEELEASEGHDEEPGT
jgi:hypothetical protein